MNSDIICEAPNGKFINTSLEMMCKLNVERARNLPCMMRNNIAAIKLDYEMHLTNAYKFKFGEVCSAFIKKYQDENTTFTTTSIAHVS